MRAIFLPLLVFCMMTNLLQAQEKEPVRPIIGAAMQDLIENEKQSFPGLNQRQNGTNGFTVASGNFDVKYYRCEWQADPNTTALAGKVTSYFTIVSATNNIVFDLNDTLSVDSIYYHGSPGSFLRPGNDGVTIQFPSTLPAGRFDSVSVYYHGTPRVSAVYQPVTQSFHSGVPSIRTQSESYGSREWWPCKNGLDDKADSTDFIITTPSAYLGSTNGIMTLDTVIGANRITYWKHRYPIASYLVAMAVSNYVILRDTVTTNGVTLPIVNYAYPENVANFIASRDPLQKTFDLFAGVFGTYPFYKEKYGFTQWGSGGGMEHQTNSFVKLPSIDLVCHETAHQWFGDRITCGSWQDIFLNEGFAFYCQLMYNERYQPSVQYITLDALCSSIGSIPGGSVWVDDTTDVHRIFDGRLTYYKGSYLLHMLRWKLGDSTFFRGVRRYLNDSSIRFSFARQIDLQRNLEQESGQNLSSFFNKWYYGQGIPANTVNWLQDTSGLAYVKIDQTTSHSSVSFFEMPVPVRFRNSVRDTIVVFNQLRNGQTFIADIGFKADSAFYDPYYWILSPHNKPTIKQACSYVNPNDSLLPYYKVSWLQNINQWVKLDITQSNTAAAAPAENIPMYLHFTGGGRDTVFTVKNIRYNSSTWLNPGFKVENVFITPGSCFLAANYSINAGNPSSVVNDIKIYPSPFGTNLSVSIKNPSFKKLNLLLFSTDGKLVYKTSANLPGTDDLITIRVPSLTKGTYVLKLTDGDKWIHTKMVLKL